ncbi:MULTISPECIES: hypothetical protein [Enterobacter]|uniref:hypothetical protein n=1 Tax=Enterobacter TaxID=547 RepID=UPI0018730C63|nr:hypothetical protein [Enterobacter cloacae complex sp. P38RS]MBE4871846.1 hypothetical protein [Enterobacter cloacae complex sp. P38RS]
MKIGLYSVNDKAMFDALNQTKVTHEDMKSLFFKRGTIISKETKRKALALDFSKNYHGYDDFEYLSGILGSVGRREKLSINIVNTSIKKDDMEATLKSICEDLQKEGDITNITFTEKGFDVSVKYVKLDYKMSEFRQSSSREAKIQVEINETGEYITRFPQNAKARDFNDRLIGKIKEENQEAQASLEEISLETVKDHTERSNFFKQLIISMPNYKCIDVSDVYVTHPILEAKKHPKQDNEPVDDDEHDDDDDDTVIDTGYHISKASLKGRGVLESPELKELLSKGFYITKIVWISVVEHFKDSDKYEFEAQFVDPDNCKLFSYLVRGLYKYKKINDYTHRQNVDKEKENVLLLSIENTARAISGKIVSSHTLEVVTE